MKLKDLITSKDGSISITKLAACTFHFLIAAGVTANTVANEFAFDIEVWALYGAFAVGHASYDKTIAGLRDLQQKKINSSEAEQ